MTKPTPINMAWAAAALTAGSIVVGGAIAFLDTRYASAADLENCPVT